MSGRIFDSRIAQGIAPDDRARQERLKATARALVTAVRDGLVRDGVVRLHGFGTFRLRPVAARRGRHPRTGEPIDIPAGWRVMFRPAKALRERVEPDRAPALPIGEPHASREAMLTASAETAAQSIRRGAGRIPAEGIAVTPPVEPERAAAAAMPERKFSVQGPIPPGSADLEADSRVTRSPAALTRAPAANEPAPKEAPCTEPAVEEAPVEQPRAVPGRGRRRNRYRYALVLLLLLLLAGVAWLFRPVDSPAPRVAEEPGPTAPAETTGDALSGAPDTAAAPDGAVVREPESPMTGTDPASDRSGTEEDVTAVREMAEAPSADRDGTASPEDTGAAGEGAVDSGDTAVAVSERIGNLSGTVNDAGAVDETADELSTAAADRDVPASADDTGATDEGGAEAGETTVAGAEPTPDRAGSRDDPARADEPAPSAATDVTSGDEVMVALSQAAEATRAMPSETAGTSAEKATGGDASGEAAANGAAAPEPNGIDDSASAAVGTRTADGVAPEGESWFSGRDYTVRAGDTLWDLADRHYVNPYYWPHIWQHNADIANPDRLEVRQGLWLPTLEGDPRSLTEADRRSIAEGYLLLYRFYREQGDANPQYALVGVRYFDPSVLPERLRSTSAGHPGDTLAAAFQARLEAEFPLD